MTEKRKIVNKLKKNIRRGFTMAELLVVVAIIGILAAFGFVNVYRYQKNLHLTELDDTAREIYVAAQEHLTVAKASGAWGVYYTASLEDEQNSESTNSNKDFLGEKLQTKTVCELTDYPDYDKGSESLFWKTDKHDYRRLTITDNNVDNIQNGILRYLLPAGAIDGTVMPSPNGTHRIVIEYDAKTAVVYAVWYTDGKSGWFGSAKDNSMPDEKMLSGKTKDDGKDARHTKTVRRNSKPQVGYYYGGVHTDDLKKLANDSDVEIVNADKLYLRIALPENKRFKVDKITAKGEESQIAEELNLNNAQIFYQNDAYEITNDKTDQSTYVCYLLDSVTDGAKGHFASKFKKILPGEDVTFTVDYTTGSQKKVARVSDNSLFASIFQNNSNHYTANIEYGRQLQNLSTAVSNVNVNTDILAVSGARLNNDLNWNNFYYADKTDTVWFRNSSENVGNISLYRTSEIESNKADTRSKGFYSIDNNELTSLDGNNKKIENIKIQPEQLSKASGLIANNETNLTIRNLTMKNPSFDDSSNDDSDFSGVFVGTSDGNLTINNSTLETDENHNLKMEASKATGTIVGSSESNQGLTLHNVDVKLLGTEASTVSAGDQNIRSTENVTVGNAGGMIGYLKGHADIKDCSITTNSNLSVAGVCENEKNNGGNAGGFIGYADDTNISIDKISIKLTDEARDSHGIDINGKTNAGGLIGYLDTADSNNNTIENVEYDGGENGVVQSGSRAAGGFIARLESNGLTISDCGVSSYIYLKKSGNAGRTGGFIGYIKQEQNGTTITRCYYGGRTDNTGKYDTQNKGYDGSGFHKGGYNIVNEGKKDGDTVSAAGGFIGTVQGDKQSINVSSSYTTGSVYIEDNDGEAGGFVGKASSSDVAGDELPLILQNTYATGIVGSGTNDNTNRGAFSGHFGINTQSRNNYYLSGINDDSMFVIGNAGGKNTSFNNTKNAYTDTEEKKLIVGSGSTTATPFISSNSCDTAPYANSLKGKKYPYQFVTELGNGNQESTLRKHIGDWPIVSKKIPELDVEDGTLFYDGENAWINARVDGYQSIEFYYTFDGSDPKSSPTRRDQWNGFNVSGIDKTGYKISDTETLDKDEFEVRIVGIIKRNQIDGKENNTYTSEGVYKFYIVKPIYYVAVTYQDKIQPSNWVATVGTKLSDLTFKISEQANCHFNENDGISFFTRDGDKEIPITDKNTIIEANKDYYVRIHLTANDKYGFRSPGEIIRKNNQSDQQGKSTFNAGIGIENERVSEDNIVRYGVHNTELKFIAKLKTDDIKMSQISPAVTQIQMKPGEVYKMTYKYYPDFVSNDSVMWATSDPSVATVDQNGNITSHGSGKAKIIIQSEDKGAMTSIDVTVRNVLLTTITPDNWYISLKIGEIYKVGYKYAPEDATDHSVTWESSDNNIVEVNQAGYVTAKNSGNANIKITAKDGSNTSVQIGVYVNDLKNNDLQNPDRIPAAFKLNESLKSDENRYLHKTYNKEKKLYYAFDQNASNDIQVSGVEYVHDDIYSVDISKVKSEYIFSNGDNMSIELKRGDVVFSDGKFYLNLRDRDNITLDDFRKDTDAWIILNDGSTTVKQDKISSIGIINNNQLSAQIKVSNLNNNDVVYVVIKDIQNKNIVSGTIFKNNQTYADGFDEESKTALAGVSYDYINSTINLKIDNPSNENDKFYNRFVKFMPGDDIAIYSANSESDLKETIMKVSSEDADPYSSGNVLYNYDQQNKEIILVHKTITNSLYGSESGKG